MLTRRSGQFYPHSSENVLTGRWQGPITTDRTRPVANIPHWNLTGVDQTLVLSVRSLDLYSVRSNGLVHLSQLN